MNGLFSFKSNQQDLSAVRVARGAVRKVPAGRKGVSRFTTLPGQLALHSLLPRFVLLLVVLLAVVSVIYMPSWLSRYPVTNVSVEGVADARRQNEIEVLLSALVAGENYFSIPLEQAHDSIDELPWVQSVSLKRIWPGSLIVQVNEKNPVAVWNGETLISSEGDLFEARDQYVVKGLPVLSGPELLVEDVMGLYHSLAKIVNSTGLTVSQLDVNARLTAQVTFSNGLVLLVDRESTVKKLRRFVQFYQQVLVEDSRKINRIDLRYADGMAVQWQQPEKVQSKEKRV